jgi:hypothetical protein
MRSHEKVMHAIHAAHAGIRAGPRVRRARTAHSRERLYLAQKWALSLRRKAALLGEDIFVPLPMAWDFAGGEFRHAAYFRALFAWFRERGY